MGRNTTKSLSYVSFDSIDRLKSYFNMLIGNYKKKVKKKELESFYREMTLNSIKVNILYTHTINHFVNKKIIYKTAAERGRIYRMFISNPHKMIDELRFNRNVLYKI